MQLLTQEGSIVYTADDKSIVSYDKTKNQVVLNTIKYTHDDVMINNNNNNNNFKNFNSLVNLFSTQELIALYSTFIASYYGEVINSNYPAYKQMNIIRQAEGYNSNDLQTMTSFIDKCRTDCKAKLSALQSLTNSQDVISYQVYN